MTMSTTSFPDYTTPTRHCIPCSGTEQSAPEITSESLINMLKKPVATGDFNSIVTTGEHVIIL